MFVDAGTSNAGRSRLLAGLSSLLLLLAGCGGTGAGDSAAGVATPSSAITASTIDVGEMLSSLPRLEGDSTTEQLVEADWLIRRGLVDELGLADVLTEELYAAGAVQMARTVADAFPSLAGEPSAAGGVFGLLAATRTLPILPKAPPVSGLHTAPSWASSSLSGMWYDAAQFQEFLKDSDSGSRTIEDEGGITTKIEGKYERRGRQLYAEVTMTVTYNDEGTDYVEVTHVTVLTDICPDSDGSFHVSYDIDYSLTGGRTVKRTISGTAVGHVGDDAWLKSVDYQTETDNGSGSPFSLTYSQSATPNARGDAVSYGERDITGASGMEGKSDLEMFSAVGSVLWFGGSLVQDVIEHAQNAWRNGGCVNIVVPEGRKHEVKPNESFTFTVKVEHLWDGGDVPAPVDAELLGSGTLAPGRIDPAPDSFVITAGSGTYATVELETTSRRGRDQDAVAFDITTRTFTVSFKGTFDYDFSGLTIHGDVEIPPIVMKSQANAGFEGEGPVQLALSANIPGCGKATGMQPGGTIVLTARPTGEVGEGTFRFVAEETDAGTVTLECQGASGFGGAGIAAGAALINLGEITVPVEGGDYSFRNEGTVMGTAFVVQGVATMTVPES